MPFVAVARSGITVTVSILASVLVVIPSVVSRAAPPALDANALVRRMVYNYQTVQAYKETSETRFVRADGVEYIQTTKLSYMRPNLLLLETHDPDQGTMWSCSNGQVVTFYAGKSNVYVLRTAPPTVALAVAEVAKAADQLIGTPDSQVLSPLSFLSAKGMPVEARQFRFIRKERVQGHLTAFLKADADIRWLMDLFPPGTPVTFDKRELSLWIDLSTKLLVRSSCDIVWKVGTSSGMIPKSLRFTEIHRDIAMNAPLRAEDFKIPLPKGATEVFPERR